jgi:hypothetical protein
MLDGLAPLFTTKYVGLYKILHEPHPDVYTLKLFINFLAHLTFHISELKLFLHDEHRLNQKQKVLLVVDAIEHKFVIEIKGIFRGKQTCFRNKECLLKYKGCHHKEAMWMKLTHLDDMLDMVAKFE